MKSLYLKQCKGKGRGVFCKQIILQDELIEISPLIIIPASQREWLIESKLVDYFFSFDDENEKASSLALGFGGLYNHAELCNATYQVNHEKKQIEFYALCDIPAHTEICINYGGEYGENYSKWFEDRNIVYKQ